MANKPDLPKEIAKLSLKPGDILVVFTLDPKHPLELSKWLKEELGSHVPVMGANPGAFGIIHCQDYIEQLVEAIRKEICEGRLRKDVLDMVRLQERTGGSL